MARRPGSPAEPPSRMARATARASSPVACGPSSRLKATSGGRAATRTAPAVGCMRSGPKSGRRPSAIRCARPGGPALAQLGARAPVGQQAVEEDGQAELAEGVGQRERLGQRGAALLRGPEDDGRDVDGPDVRMKALVAREVDALDRFAGAARQRLVERPGLGREGEDGAVVIGVLVAVEDAGAAGGEGVADGVEGDGVAALGDVGDGEEHAQST